MGKKLAGFKKVGSEPKATNHQVQKCTHPKGVVGSPVRAVRPKIGPEGKEARRICHDPKMGKKWLSGGPGWNLRSVGNATANVN